MQNIELFRNIVFCSIQLIVVAAAAAVIFLENVIIFPIDFFLCYYTLISIVAGLGWAGLGWAGLGWGSVVTEIAENENKGNKHFVCLQQIWDFERSFWYFTFKID